MERVRCSWDPLRLPLCRVELSLARLEGPADPAPEYSDERDVDTVVVERHASAQPSVMRPVAARGFLPPGANVCVAAPSSPIGN